MNDIWLVMLEFLPKNLLNLSYGGISNFVLLMSFSPNFFMEITNGNSFS